MAVRRDEGEEPRVFVSVASVEPGSPASPASEARPGGELGPYDEVWPPGVSFAPDGRAAWVARRGARWSLVIDGRELASGTDVPDGARPHWGPDGLRMALLRGRHLVALAYR